jgi:hypothetical protein
VGDILETTREASGIDLLLNNNNYNNAPRTEQEDAVRRVLLEHPRFLCGEFAKHPQLSLFLAEEAMRTSAYIFHQSVSTLNLQYGISQVQVQVLAPCPLPLLLVLLALEADRKLTSALRFGD